MLKVLKSAKTETEYRNDVHFVRVLMTRWETALLPWDLLCSPGRIAWEGDNKQSPPWTDFATTRPLRFAKQNMSSKIVGWLVGVWDCKILELGIKSGIN